MLFTCSRKKSLSTWTSFLFSFSDKRKAEPAASADVSFTFTLKLCLFHLHYLLDCIHSQKVLESPKKSQKLLKLRRSISSQIRKDLDIQKCYCCGTSLKYHEKCTSLIARAFIRITYTNFLRKWKFKYLIVMKFLNKTSSQLLLQDLGNYFFATVLKTVSYVNLEKPSIS